MSLSLIIGPMKSGKSLELIARMSELQHSTLSSILIQPKLNVREEGVRSRAGIELDAIKLNSLGDLNYGSHDVIGVDEAFMFGEDDTKYIKQWLSSGKQVIICTLDISAMGNLFPFVRNIYELKPDEIIVKTSVCEVCKNFGAQFTQIHQNGVPVRSGLPDVVPEDGTYDYRPACRKCYY